MPSALVVVSRSPAASRLVSITFTSTTIAPLGSVTVPLMVPDVDWLKADETQNNTAASPGKTCPRTGLILLPPDHEVLPPPLIDARNAWDDCLESAFRVIERA